MVNRGSSKLPATLIAVVLLGLAAALAATAIGTKVIRGRQLAAGDGRFPPERGGFAAQREGIFAWGRGKFPGRARIFARRRESLSAWRRERLAARYQAAPQEGISESDRLRVYGDRIRVALDEHGAQVLIVGVGLAAAVLLGALVGGM